MPESETNRENVRANFRDAQHMATYHRFGAYDFELPNGKGAGRRVSSRKPGDTSFLDGIALSGWLTEEIGQGVHENRAHNSSGHELPQTTDVNSGSSLTHIAWISHAKLLGAWYGAETIISAAYVDTGSNGTRYGFGAITLGPVFLQWPEQQLWGVPIYPRAVLDLDAPTGKYSANATVNIGNNAWDIQPYYAVTLFPMKSMETSWRIH